MKSKDEIIEQLAIAAFECAYMSVYLLETGHNEERNGFVKGYYKALRWVMEVK